jgi:hypothetical protein
MLAGKVLAMHELADKTHDWAKIWPVPAFLSVGVLVIFALFFKEPAAKLDQEAELSS